MKIIVISIIPEIIESYVNYGVIKKAIDRKIIDIEVINVRHFSEDSYIDDKPYGGGAGMIIKVEPLVKATRFAKNKLNNQHSKSNSHCQTNQETSQFKT